MAFSCKHRGLCPSCGTRRMCNEAVQLVKGEAVRHGAVCVFLHAHGSVACTCIANGGVCCA